MTQCPEHEDLFEYALAGLEPGQQEKVRHHLGSCRGCQDQIREYARVHEGLALCAPDVDPPAGLEAGVMARIRRERAAAQNEPARDRLRLGGWAMFWMRVGPVFAVMSLVMTGAAFLYMNKSIQWQRVAQAPSADPSLDQARLHSLMAGADIRTVSLKGMDGHGCKGAIVCSPDSKYLLVSVDKLHRCSYGRLYTVWLEDSNGTTRKLATFAPEQDEVPQNYLVEMNRAMGNVSGKKVKITLQLDGGEEPDGELYLASATSL